LRFFVLLSSSCSFVPFVDESVFSVMNLLPAKEASAVNLFAELHRVAECPRGHDLPAWRTIDEFDDQGHGITLVGLERSPCFGECPVYTALIHADGLVEYQGRLYVERLGDHRGKVGQYEFQRLAQFIAGTRFWQMESYYDFRNAVVSDCAAACVLVATPARRKLVSNYADAGPPELWAIAGLIDLLLHRVEWE
jgi:hypothetical protein